MNIRIGRKLINTDNLVDSEIYEVGEIMSEHGGGQAEARTIVITTTALETAEDGILTARKIWLQGDDADLFIESLPVYAPVLEHES